MANQMLISLKNSICILWQISQVNDAKDALEDIRPKRYVCLAEHFMQLLIKDGLVDKRDEKRRYLVGKHPE